VPLFSAYEALLAAGNAPFSAAVKHFCVEHCLNADSMNTIKRVRDQFVGYLQGAGLVQLPASSSSVEGDEADRGAVRTKRFGPASRFSDELVSVRSLLC
jgi:hypothetical protein